ncbi:uncharacterized protein PHACADRAFT_147193 [Phanerochaete carnosa HHB-10118-sp]|uniref:Methyltransferase domain-containing protein n=1 Tax=Phanerochaete carnosa (strain HHB-10118-sp) TaxID=650164 RepID=K5W7H4_PHACS|nr:uncharacterized protein PHACADRAFT_147193 [Phanerochaete carnosa HHB-10118-sp]EKM54909.1 hypothetical protein PHACADRAFT_147193 [Phanerochaete carnosa HHB-10118-sp]
MAILGTNNFVIYVNRHPRYALFLVVFLALSTLLLLPWHSAAPLSISAYVANKFRGSMSLEEFIRQEELRYADVLAERHALIKHHGPSPDEVDSFPPGDISYTLWDFFTPAFNCPHRVDRLGALGDGGKWVCGIDAIAQQRHPCIVYSFGINHDSSWEAALLQRAPHCEVWGYDFSVTMFGPVVQNNPVLAPKTHFFPYKLGMHDNPHHSPPEYTVQGLMHQNGHEFIDVLKIDVEGSEFDGLAAFLKPFIGPDAPPLPIGQLEIEIHAWGDLGSFGYFYSWWSLFERAGLRPFWTEPNIVHVSHLQARPDVVEVCFSLTCDILAVNLFQYSLLNVRGQHALITSGW